MASYGIDNCEYSSQHGSVASFRNMWTDLDQVGATLQTSAYTLAHLIVGRVITGFGTGIDSSTVPMYQSELCKKEWRGRIVAWEIWFIGIGICLAYWIDCKCLVLVRHSLG